jgi:hypothetical protein
MDLLKSGVAVLAALVAASALQHADWRARNTERIQEAVLLDMLRDDFRWGFSGHPSPLTTDRVACVGYRNSILPSRPSGAAIRDPSAATLVRLRGLGRPVVPASECLMVQEHLTDRGSGRRAMLLIAYTPRWIDDSFVKIDGEWWIGFLYAAGSEYSVSFSDWHWSVDSVKFTWVSDAAEQPDEAVRATVVYENG